LLIVLRERESARARERERRTNTYRANNAALEHGHLENHHRRVLALASVSRISMCNAAYLTLRYSFPWKNHAQCSIVYNKHHVHAAKTCMQQSIYQTSRACSNVYTRHHVHAASYIPDITCMQHRIYQTSRACSSNAYNKHHAHAATHVRCSIIRNTAIRFLKKITATSRFIVLKCARNCSKETSPISMSMRDHSVLPRRHPRHV